jgi:peptide/nickel transport system permease protein
MFGVSVFVFLILHLVPGDVADLLASQARAGISPEQTAELRQRLGLDAPIAVQYVRWLGKALTGDLGRSYYTNRLVADTIIEQIPATLRLAGAAMLLAVALGGSLGIVAALNQNTWIDSFALTFSLGGLSVPMFWSGLMLIYLFAVQLNWLPVTTDQSWRGLVLPATVLAYDTAAFITRMVRTSVLEILRQDYVTTARAKGLRERVVIARHVMKPALPPIATLLGLLAGRLLGGTVVVETVFARQGLGRLAVDSILYKDYFLVQGIVLFVALVYVLINLLVDISYFWLDPRVRAG